VPSNQAGQTFNPLWWPSLTKGMQTEQLLCCSGMTDTEHIITSGSNEDKSRCHLPKSTATWAWVIIGYLRHNSWIFDILTEGN